MEWRGVREAPRGRARDRRLFEVDCFQVFALINAPQVKLQTETHFVLSEI